MSQPSSGRWHWLKLLAPVLAAFLGLAALKLLSPHVINHTVLSQQLQRFGRWAPLVFIVVLTLRPLILAPGQLLTAVGGLLFGALWGSVYALIGSLTSSLVVFALADRLGQRLMKRAAGDHYAALVRSAKQHDFQFAVIATINPLIPTDVAIAVAAASKARAWPTILGVLIGTVPGTLLTAAFGSALGQGKTLLSLSTAAGMVLSLVLGVILGRRMIREIAGAPAELREGQPATN